jgi:hypothetical protein
MTTSTHSQFTTSPRGKVFWGVVGALVVAQFVAFYMLCAHQVEVAQARDTRVAAHGTAIRDCLETPHSTIGSCIRMAAGDRTPAPSRGGEGVMQASFSFR